VLEKRYLDLIAGRSNGPLASATRGMLAAAEMPYAWIMQLRNRRYDAPSRTFDLGRPTVSVGNITAGGTGKTPVVHWLASRLLEQGQRPAVLMRGYRKAGATGSDEQRMLQTLLPAVPVEANPDRIAGARDLLARADQTTCFILDDGFQHRRARRNVDLVLIHAAEPFGFGHVHPRGLLREPLGGLRRASAILLTHASEPSPEAVLRTQEIIGQYSSAPVFHCDHVNLTLRPADDGRSVELSDLAKMPFVLFAGIGQPQTLAGSLRRFALSYRGERFFDDHHHYTEADLVGLAELCRASRAEALVTTEKDFAKLQELIAKVPQLPPIFRLQLQIRFWEHEEFALLEMITAALGEK
jgi:tetraacyldisaccharide 4'-kinase